jgi:ABC-type transport system involved in Fe-S cluster assembly fused permease/ATPase subunit
MTEICSADEIIMLENGEVQICGDHDEVLSQSRTYKELFEIEKKY